MDSINWQILNIVSEALSPTALMDFKDQFFEFGGTVQSVLIFLLVLTELPQPLALYKKVEEKHVTVIDVVKPIVIFSLLMLCTAFIMSEV